MRTHRIARTLATLCAVAWLGVAGLDAHHGTLINYDRSKQWTAKAVVREFKYVNPHAQLFFDVTDDKGKVTHWSGELLPNPAQLIRNGWTKKRSIEALQSGTPIVVTIVPSRKGGDVALVMKIENEKGDEILGAPVPAQ